MDIKWLHRCILENKYYRLTKFILCNLHKISISFNSKSFVLTLEELSSWAHFQFCLTLYVLLNFRVAICCFFDLDNLICIRILKAEIYTPMIVSEYSKNKTTFVNVLVQTVIYFVAVLSMCYIIMETAVDTIFTLNISFSKENKSVPEYLFLSFNYFVVWFTQMILGSLMGLGLAFEIMTQYNSLFFGRETTYLFKYAV